MVIIAAIDRSERAANVIQEAERLANAFDEPIHVVHVMTKSEFIDLGRTRSEGGDPVEMDEVRETARKVSEEAARGIDTPYEAVGLMGDPAQRVVDYADDHEGRYIVVAGRRRSPAGKAVFKSVAQRILLNATVPVVSTIEQT